MTDPKIWPVVECEPADVCLGSADQTCTLTPEQAAWPVVECESADVSVESQNPTAPRHPGPIATVATAATENHLRRGFAPETGGE